MIDALLLFDTNIMTQRHLLKHPVDFVAKTNLSDDKDEPSSSTAPQTASTISGEEARNIYLSIIKAPSQSDTKKMVRRQAVKICKAKKIMKAKEKVVKSTNPEPAGVVTDRMKNKFLFAVHNNDYSAVKEMLASHPQLVHIKDNYQWTPLMVASQEGYFEMCKLLLKNNATWFGIRDRGGNDAYSLACNAAHIDVAHLLLHHRDVLTRERIREMTAEALRKVKKEKLWCEYCRHHYYSSALQHHASITHQLSDMAAKPAPKTHFFLAHQGSSGYGLLKKQGWDGESGLGPDKQGSKFPVKTVLKRDRNGLGLDDNSKRARVTHFDPNDVAAVARPPKNKKREKAIAKLKEEQFKAFEIEFRRSFYTSG